MKRAPAIVAFVSLGLSAQVGYAQGGNPFSASERAQLDRGELVVRPESRQRGELRLVGGTSWQVINAPPDAVWRAFMDTPRYPRLMPQVSGASVVREQPQERIVRVTHQTGPVESSYHLTISMAAQARVAQFRVDTTRPHDIRDGWGFLMVAPYSGGRSMVTFGALVDVGTGFIAGLTRPQIQEWLLRVPSAVRQFVEGSGRALYMRP